MYVDNMYVVAMALSFVIRATQCGAHSLLILCSFHGNKHLSNRTKEIKI